MAFSHNSWAPCLYSQPCSRPSRPSRPWWLSALSSEPPAAWWILFALKCLKMGNVEDKMKASLMLTAGIIFLLSGSSIFSERCSKTDLRQTHCFSVLTVRWVWHHWMHSFCFVTYMDEGFGVVGRLAVAGLMGAQTSRWCHTRTISTFSFGCWTFCFTLWILRRYTLLRPFCGMDRQSHSGRRRCHNVLGVPCNGTGTKAMVGLQKSYSKDVCIFL